MWYSILFGVEFLVWWSHSFVDSTDVGSSVVGMVFGAETL